MRRFLFICFATLLVTACANDITPNISTDNLQVKEQKEQNEYLINTNQTNEKQMPKIQEEKNSSTVSLKSEDSNFALIKTSMGDIKIKLFAEESPITVENFKKYIDNKFYDGTVFHRVMDGFMVQGGGFDINSEQKQTLPEIKNEAKNGIKNTRGTLAMARTMVVDSATAQFFINLVDNDFLNYKDDANYGYAVFAEVVDGMDIVNEIAKVETGNNGPHQNWPTKNIIINSIEMVE